MIITKSMFPDSTILPVEVIDAYAVGVQVSEDRRRVWVCVNGVCVLRIKQSAGNIDFDIPPFKPESGKKKVPK